MSEGICRSLHPLMIGTPVGLHERSFALTPSVGARIGRRTLSARR
ncbi:MAG TPA: hypothetical protein VGL37_01260 [Solirubrobacteraceae bacterium]|jgi:hypothetical protein